jgi:hypothetical protein
MEPIHSEAVTGKFEDGLRSIRRLGLLVAISRGKDFNNISDLIDSFLGTLQMEESLRRFRELPGSRQMLEERYPPPQPRHPTAGRLSTGEPWTQLCAPDPDLER